MGTPALGVVALMAACRSRDSDSLKKI